MHAHRLKTQHFWKLHLMTIYYKQNLHADLRFMCNYYFCYISFAKKHWSKHIASSNEFFRIICSNRFSLQNSDICFRYKVAVC